MRVLFSALAAALGLIFAAVLLLVILPTPHTRLHYMVAGLGPALVVLLVIGARTERDRARVQRWDARRVTSGTPHE